MRQKRTLYFLAVLLIVVGVLLTLENLVIIQGISKHWPLFLIILGSGFIMLFFHKDRIDEVLVWLGTFILLLGGFFYYLNYTSWNLLATLWPVFLGLVGLSFLSIGVMKGKKLFVYLAVAFIAFFLIFTMVFAISTSLWPISFVVFGISLLIIEYLNKKTNH